MKLKRNLDGILKYTLIIILSICIFFSIPISKSIAVFDNIQDRKAIVLILDEVSLEEIFNSNTPNIDGLLENGSMGFMNTRAKSSVSNKGSAYLSLGMGVRTLASSQGGLALEKNKMYPLSDYNSVQEYIMPGDLYKLYTGKSPGYGEIINVAMGDIEKTALNITPNSQVGLLGKIAKEKGLVIGAIGNSDLNKLSREFTMLAMDENGIIPYGRIDSDLLISDADVLGGIRLNQEMLLEEVERILPHINILFMDYGDTVRVQRSDQLATDIIREEQKNKAIEGADQFLGKVINKVNLEKTLFLIISPNASKEMVSQGNFALTPIIMSGPNIEKGLLTSSSTRREGLVTNFDFGPTILNYFGTSKSIDFIGEPMKSISNDSPREVLLRTQAQSLYLRKYRKVFHWALIILVGIVLIGLYLPKFIKLNIIPTKILKYLSLTAIATPLTMMTVSILGYKSIILDLTYVLGGAFIMVYILNRIINRKVIITAILGLTTSLLILFDIFFMEKLMIISPLGSDAIAGGRFYGIGNDYMGILLGSTLLGLFSLYHIYKINKPTMLAIITSYMFLVIVALSPFFGANMGGTLSAIFIVLLVFLTILDKKISMKSMGITIIGAIVFGILLGQLDTLFNPNPTHAGKALEALMLGGLDKFLEIIGIKLKQVFWNIANSSWNIILFLQIALIALLYKFKNEDLIRTRDIYPKLFKGFLVTLLGSIVIFLLNDTGTIATALILIYVFIPLGILLNNDLREEF